MIIPINNSCRRWTLAFMHRGTFIQMAGLGEGYLKFVLDRSFMMILYSQGACFIDTDGINNGI